jgi:hypothetical protein
LDAITTDEERDAALEKLDTRSMLATVPTTLAGIRALAEYAATEDVELEGLPGGVEALSATIVAAIDGITA